MISGGDLQKFLNPFSHWGDDAIVEFDEMDEIKSVRVNIVSIGEVLLERSYRAKRICIYVRPPAKVRVAVPAGEDFLYAYQHTLTMYSDIKNYLKKYAESKAKHVHKKPDEKQLPSIKKRLQERVEYLANLHGFQYNKLTFRSMFTRWGSCSIKNNIGLNILMYQLSDEMQDYLILHELMHTKIRNHGNDYWDELDKITGDAKKLHKKLMQDYLLYN